MWREKLKRILQLKPIFYLSQHETATTDFTEDLKLN
jgi:hypothetical protein